MIKTKQNPMGVAGHVRIWKVGKDGNVNFNTKFKNLVLDQFFTIEDVRPPTFIPWSASGSGGNNYYNGNCWLSSEVTTPPDVTDTTMSNFIARADEIVSGQQGYVQGSESDGSEDYRFISRVFRFDEDTANGDLTEVGMGPGNSTTSTGANTVCFKSLIKDSEGNPIVVTKEQGDVLFVEYEIRFYRPADRISEPFVVPGNSGEYRLIKTYVGEGAVPILGTWGAYPWGSRGADSDAFAYMSTVTSGSNLKYPQSKVSDNTTPGYTGSTAFSSSRVNTEYTLNLVRTPQTSPYTIGPALANSHVFWSPSTGEVSITEVGTNLTHTLNLDENTLYSDLSISASTTLGVRRLLAGAIGILVDADTLEPKTITVPEGFRLTIAVDHGQAVVRR